MNSPGEVAVPSYTGAVPVRVIAIDLDGTLLDSEGHVPAVNRQAILDAVEKGVEVVLVTGRSFHHARPVADDLPDRIVLIVSNGALIKTHQGETVVQHFLPRQVAGGIITATRPFREGAAVVFDRADGRQYVFERIDWQHPNRRPYFERNRAFIVEHTPLEDALIEDPVQVMFSGSVAAMRDLAARVRSLSRADRFTVTLTEYEDRDFSLLDVTTQGCSKGAALAEWVTRRGVTAAEVMAIGDNLNDREMLEFAGHPVVMGNAVAELKAFGWPQTRSNDEGGVAAALRGLKS